MRDRPFEHTSTPALRKLICGLTAVVNEAPPDHGALTCALLSGLVKHELKLRGDPAWCDCGPDHECEGHRA